MTPYPMVMQTRHLQALADVASDENSTLMFPLPLELLGAFLRTGRDGAGAGAGECSAGERNFGVKNPAQPEQITAAGATLATAGGNGRWQPRREP
jgi:hypothetical protein